MGVVLATQNPMDLDYRALSNAGVWCVSLPVPDRTRPYRSPRRPIVRRLHDVLPEFQPSVLDDDVARREPVVARWCPCIRAPGQIGTGRPLLPLHAYSQRLTARSRASCSFRGSDQGSNRGISLLLPMAVANAEDGCAIPQAVQEFLGIQQLHAPPLLVGVEVEVDRIPEAP